MTKVIIRHPEKLNEYPIADYLDYYEYYFIVNDELELKRRLYYDFKLGMYKGVKVIAEKNEDLKELKGRFPHYFKTGLKPVKRGKIKNEFFIDYDIEDPLKNIDIWNYISCIARTIIVKSELNKENILSWIKKKKQPKPKRWRFWK